MNTRIIPVIFVAAAGLVVTQARADIYTPITDFTKDANLQQNGFPTYPSGTFTSNGVTFDISSDTSGNNFYDFFNNSSTPPLVIPVNVADVTSVYTIINAYHPDIGDVGSITFTGSGGATETFDLSANPNAPGGADVRDFFQDGFNNTLNATNAFNVFTGVGQGAGGTGNVHTGETGTYVLDAQEFTLSSAFAGQTLEDITLSPTPTAGGVPFIAAVTVATPSPTTVPEPASLTLLGTALLGLIGLRRRRTRNPG